MSEKEEFDSLYVFWKNSWDSFYNRRPYEFKIGLAIWTSLSSLIGIVLVNDIPKISYYVLGPIIVIAIALLILHAMWLSGIHKAYNKDRVLADFYSEKMHNLINNDIYDKLKHRWELLYHEKYPPKPVPPICNWSHFPQLLITLALLLFLIVTFIFHSDVNSSNTKKPQIKNNNTVIIKADR